MKKKILLIIMICIGLTSCNAKQESQFNEETNQKISSHGLKLQVPKEWEREKIENMGDAKDTQYFMIFLEEEEKYIPRNYLMITIYSEKALAENAPNFKFYVEEKIKRMKTDKKVTDVKKSKIIVSGISATKIISTKDMGKDGNYKFNTILIRNNKGFMEIMFTSNNETGFEDFEKVLKSMVIEKN